MSLDVYIKYKEPRMENYFLNHPYSYNDLSKRDKEMYCEEDSWSCNVTHNLGNMASNVPVVFNGKPTTLYYVCWRPEEIGIKTVADILHPLTQGICYMVTNRRNLLQYNPENGWGDYNAFMKFLLNYKQACEDNDPECLIDTWR